MSQNADVVRLLGDVLSGKYDLPKADPVSCHVPQTAYLPHHVPQTVPLPHHVPQTSALPRHIPQTAPLPHNEHADRPSDVGRSESRQAPQRLRLALVDEQAEMEDHVRLFLGTYRLSSRLVNGKPAWRHETRHKQWVAFNGRRGWHAQMEHELGQRRGWLTLEDSNCDLPCVSKVRWLCYSQARHCWYSVRALACKAVKPVHGSGSCHDALRPPLRALGIAQAGPEQLVRVCKQTMPNVQALPGVVKPKSPVRPVSAEEMATTEAHLPMAIDADHDRSQARYDLNDSDAE